MNLEQRVELLEQEFQLLKNQIQVTLLAIQEHILTNSYPSLRAVEASGPTETTESAPELPKVAVPAKGIEGLRGIKAISVFADDEPVVETPVVVQPPVAPAPVLRNVPAASAPRPPQPVPLPTSAPALAAPVASTPEAKTTTTIDWASLNKMDEWVSQKIDKMGVQRTRKLIELYAERGRFSDSVKTTLLQLCGLYEEEADPVVEARLQAQPFNPNIDDTLTSFEPPLRTYYAESHSHPSNGKRDVAIRPAANLGDATLASNGNGQRRTALDEQHDMPRKMILKLIAGLQNAGMDWKKPNG